MGGGLNVGLMASIYAGGAVVVQEQFDGDAFFRDLEEFGVTWYGAGPAFHDAVLERLPHHREVLQLSRFRLIRSASYHLPLETRTRLETELGVTVVQKYGSTEVGMVTSERPGDPNHVVGSVGRSWQSEIEIRDEQGRPLPPGSEGEIVVRTPDQFDGYLNDPEQTAEVLKDGWMHTGDLGWLDENGYLMIGGRARDLINRGGGEGYSPKEIEEALLAHPDVQDAVVFGMPMQRLARLSARRWLLHRVRPPIPGPSPSFYGRGCLARRSPTAWCSATAFHARSAGSLPEEGRCRRLGLSADLREDDGADATRTPLEKAIAAIWCRILNLEFIRADDHFIRAGGDSLRVSAARDGNRGGNRDPSGPRNHIR